MLIRLRNCLLERAYQEVDTNFRNYYRAIITIATSIHRSRELRNFFPDLAEKLIGNVALTIDHTVDAFLQHFLLFSEPWKTNGWSETQVKDFLSALTKCVLELQSYGQTSGAEIRCLWERFMNVLNICLLRMYHN